MGTLRDAVLVAEKARVADATLTQPELDAGACPPEPRALAAASFCPHRLLLPSQPSPP